ncbi:MAG: hypothetical protein KDC80_30390 [Saprospiraceae bacterium]|nr:hypothetical protein [Saprospiraceae bacterium]
MTKKSKLILVTGDPICDHNFYTGKRKTADSSELRGFRYFHTGGGSFLLENLIVHATSDLIDWKTEFGLHSDYLALPPTSHAYCLWEPQIANPKENLSRQYEVWRAVEPALGYGHQTAIATSDETPDGHSHAINRPATPLQGHPDILVIDDAGLGFREPRYSEHWPFKGKANKLKPQWIVMKLTGSINEGELWQKILNNAINENFVLIVSVDMLRQHDVRINRGLSWEETIEDLMAELSTNPYLQPLRKAHHLIVTFRSDGAFWIDNRIGSNQGSSMLVFDAIRAEGEWALEQGKGTVFGFLSCFTAAIVRELCKAEGKSPDFESALIAGLGASRDLRRIGHGPLLIRKEQDDGTYKMEVNEEPGFPFAQIGKKVRHADERFVSVKIPKELSKRGTWMMLDEWQVHARLGSKPRPHFEAAHAVAILGPDALERFPVAQFGHLQTVDRHEIESLRNLSKLIKDYQNSGAKGRPLSIGVFGPPGAGKSFGVTQIAKSILGLKEENILTFNLSQFNDASDLNGAFHRVRDQVLKGNMPLVFWDEFDARGYYWLQYLLAPMQDGAFQEGQSTHPIGKCVFVFAGATSPTFETFGPPDPYKILPLKTPRISRIVRRDIEQQWSDFVLKKGPDFKSRLSGYLNVLGPNQRQVYKLEGSQQLWENDETDLCFPIRRALFIRSQFKLNKGEILEIDEGILHALVEIPQYKSGSRSLEFICRYMQETAKDLVPRRSHIPGHQLLNMHVDADIFWNICERSHEFADAAARLAKGLHEDWLSALSPTQRKTNTFAVPWEDLDDETKGSNLAQAARIPNIVSIVGLRVVKGKPLSAQKTSQIRQILVKNSEVLAEAEHNHWMIERMLAGWRYARIPKKDAIKKLHPLLIPYSQLPGMEKDKDRQVVKGKRAVKNTPEIPDYIERLKKIGYRLEKA